jgi:hypothetical protein
VVIFWRWGWNESLYRHKDTAIGYGLKFWPEDFAAIKVKTPEATNLEGL